MQWNLPEIFAKARYSLRCHSWWCRSIELRSVNVAKEIIHSEARENCHGRVNCSGPRKTVFVDALNPWGRGWSSWPGAAVKKRTPDITSDVHMFCGRMSNKNVVQKRGLNWAIGLLVFPRNSPFLWGMTESGLQLIRDRQYHRLRHESVTLPAQIMQRFTQCRNCFSALLYHRSFWVENF